MASVVAVADQIIVGQVWINAIEKVPNPIGERDRHAHLSNLYVQPSSRGGIGTRLLEMVLDWARANNIDRVVLWPAKPSVSLYRRHDFKRDADVMECGVDDRLNPPHDILLNVGVDRGLRAAGSFFGSLNE